MSQDGLNKNALILLIFGAFNLGFAPVFVKLIASDGGMGLTAIAFWRMAISGAIFVLILLYQRKRFFLAPGNILWSALAGVFFTLDLAVWHRSIMYSGAGIATILGNTGIQYCYLCNFLFRERPTIRFFFAAFSAMIGVTLLSGIGSNVVFTYEYVIGIAFTAFYRSSLRLLPHNITQGKQLCRKT